MRRRGDLAEALVRVATLFVAALLIIGSGAARRAGAQEAEARGEGLLLRGVVVAEGVGAPIPGAMVTLLDTAGVRHAVTLTGEDGAFALRARRPGLYRIKSERIGFRTWTSAVFRLPKSTRQPERFEIPIEPIQLAELRVERTRRCRTDPEAALRAYNLWDRVRPVLERIAVRESGERHLFSSRIIRRATHRKFRPHTRTDTTTAVTWQPLATPPPADLAERGFVQSGGGSLVYYYAPNALVLLSDAFRETHCFGFVPSDDGTTAGIAFEPVPGRSVPDVIGTLWIDTVAYVPRRLEFSYTSLSAFLSRDFRGRYRFPEHEWIRLPDGTEFHVRRAIHRMEFRGTREQAYGGRVEFAQDAAVGWITERWEVRFPTVSYREEHNAGPPPTVTVYPYAVPTTRSVEITSVTRPEASVPSDTSREEPIDREKRSVMSR